MLLHIKKISLDFNNQLPIFAIGHSMGGLLTTYAGIQEPNLFKGLIFSGPLIKMDPNIATPFNKMLAGWLQAIAPKFSLDSLDHDAITRDKIRVGRFCSYTVNVLSAKSTDECLQTKSQDN